MNKLKKNWLLFSLLSINFITNTITAGEELKPTVKIQNTPLEERNLGCEEYTVCFENMPKNKDIIVYMKRMIQKNADQFRRCEKIRFLENGVMSINGSHCLRYCLSRTGFAPGEQVTYQFKLKNGTLLAETTYIPHPFTVESKNKTFSIDVILVCGAPTLYRIALNGIPANEMMHLRSISGFEKIERDFCYDPKSPLFLMPGVKDEDGGKSRLELKRESGDEVHCTINWGLEIAKSILSQFS